MNAKMFGFACSVSESSMLSIMASKMIYKLFLIIVDAK